ncbi:uncharacterized protein VP01_3830g2 [Puccinia sorghi]|uniref:Retrotransposon gag domain-containing protein n=1 Tax=Puccinia sorghi TaxID=27349 RepID=A0A0L6UT80_9BASI|nr:uncharacterized protein VP01_3830g2 [Puccinia sorghi]
MINVCNNKPVVYHNLTEAFVAMYYNNEKRYKAERALGQLKKAESIADYTHMFQLNLHHNLWGKIPLVSQYMQGLKHDFCLSLVLARTHFSTVSKVFKLCIKIDNKISATESSEPY